MTKFNNYPQQYIDRIEAIIWEAATPLQAEIERICDELELKFQPESCNFFFHDKKGKIYNGNPTYAQNSIRKLDPVIKLIRTYMSEFDEAYAVSITQYLTPVNSIKK